MRTMTDQEAHEFLAHNKAGILALADEGRAYAVPFYYGFDGRSLYFHTQPGLKTQYLRKTAEACFTIYRVVSQDDWASVQVFGHLVPVREGTERIGAMNALMSLPLPPEWGESTFGEPSRTGKGAVAYKLTPTRIAGRYSETPRASREEKEIAFGGM